MVILQARILEWVAMPSSRGFPQHRDWIQVSHTSGRFFTGWVTKETQGSLWYLINGGSWHSAKSNTKWKTTSIPSLTILYWTVKDTIIIENILFVHQLGSSLPDGRCGVFGQNMVQCQTSFFDWAGVSNACEKSRGGGASELAFEGEERVGWIEKKKAFQGEDPAWVET